MRQSLDWLDEQTTIGKAYSDAIFDTVLWISQLDSLYL